MQMVNVNEKLQLFKDTVSKLDLDLCDDTSWPVIADQVQKKLDKNERVTFWKELLQFFEEKEKILGHCHKGMHYWVLAQYELLEGNISSALDLLKKSKEEDLIKLKGIKQYTASIGLLSILNPLLIRYKDGKGWKFDVQVNSFYEGLAKDEKEHFAKAMFESHNLTAQESIWIIKDNFFGFIQNERIREIVFKTYKEVRDVVLTSRLETYYSSIFAIGSITEGMLDDLFTRDEQKVWKAFKAKKAIQEIVHKKSKLNSTDYNSGMTLTEKVLILRMMAKESIEPISKSSILQLIIIAEYRDLIHPRRRLDFEFEAEKYVATFLFTIMGKVAGDWWPENVDKMVKV